MKKFLWMAIEVVMRLPGFWLDESILIFLNASSTWRHFRIPVSKLGWSDGRIVRDLFFNWEFTVSGSELVIEAEPWSGMWIF